MRKYSFLALLIILFIFAFSVSSLLSQDTSAELYYSLGQKYFEQGNFELAVISFKKAIAIAPNWAEAHNALGMSYAELFMFNEAISEFDKAIQIKPYYTEAKINRNRTMRSLERYAPAKKGMKFWQKITIVFGITIAISATTIIILSSRD